MSSLYRSYGAVLASLFLGIVALWLVALIALPQLNMIERAFIYEPRGGAAIQSQVDVDRLYQQIYTLEYDIQVLRQQAGDTSSVGVAPGARIGEDNTTASGLAVPSPSAAGTESAEDQIAALEAQVAGLQADLAAMEEEEGGFVLVAPIDVVQAELLREVDVGIGSVQGVRHGRHRR